MIRRPPVSTRLTHSFPTRRSSDLAEIQPGRKRAFALKRLEYIEQMPAIGVEKRRQCAAQSRRSRKSGEPLTHHLPRSHNVRTRPATETACPSVERKSTRLNPSH